MGERTSEQRQEIKDTTTTTARGRPRPPPLEALPTSQATPFLLGQNVPQVGGASQPPREECPIEIAALT